MKNIFTAKFIVCFLILLLVYPVAGQQQDQLSRSLFTDVKAHQVGDVVLVLIVETANASRESKVNSSSNSDIGLSGSVSGTLTNFLPMFGTEASVDNSHNGSEGTEQKERLTGKITATIVEQSPGGLLRIEGERVMEVNGEENLMRLSGMVRSKDILSDNTIYSYNVADANITYRKTGLVNKVAKPGKIQRLGTWLLGTSLLVVAITRAG